jgi:hypothetical protein
MKMIYIKKSETADTRSCDFSQVTKEQLLESSLQHISDVSHGMKFFEFLIYKQSKNHDADKIDDLDSFHNDFVGGFKNTTWWDKHRKINRHHLLAEDGVPEDVNLIDVLEMIVDCIMAGMARTGNVYPLEIRDEVLKKAFDNTVELLKNNVKIAE